MTMKTTTRSDPAGRKGAFKAPPRGTNNPTDLRQIATAIRNHVAPLLGPEPAPALLVASALEALASELEE